MKAQNSVQEATKIVVPMRFLVIDDHPVVREVLPAVLRKAFGEVEIHAVGDLDSAIAWARERGAPDMVLLDLGLPGCSGIEALVRLRHAHPETKVVVFSAAEDGELIRSSLKSGAAGYIPKTATPEVIAAALHLVRAGGVYIPSEALGEAPAGEEVSLTDRQLDVLRLMLNGLSNAEIARALRISESTVKQHVGDVYVALRVSTRAQAMAAAARLAIKPAR
ncbi:MAG TPA: response regulator transcription factor [Burkholderiales bacterium]|nr:response regulator transcription factor [Burkholderiales bacterium]